MVIELARFLVEQIAADGDEGECDKFDVRAMACSGDFGPVSRFIGIARCPKMVAIKLVYN